ncbi:acetoin utilization protein AcuC [Micromonospora noduli]|uniref:Acetoin utilization protein AcuC n=1 Tax=Micromonospora noduli TaxID=709876 RepID=A0A328N2R5_9ACTN|nr:acetoin utilization protein AcuC [Micromonospora noduli]KAB1927487.1 acetoin utilization protein AcuC [Micromonospora noduli]RAN97026.1 Acetoin utilization protein AcuC [Micromonospora noduli]RAO09984.1 Acetoin utilization protein AcuC [Micromonospora noduli]RAO14140.1 Acetoin utilization protein AcuC [Micromonospora noduli]RAO20476.1 Acetoin utilization protein AcuC [Micromonospora noduli]
MSDDTVVVWDESLLAYDMGDHPLDPVRVELTIALARELGILSRPGVRMVKPEPADDALLTRVHAPAYLAAVRNAPRDPLFAGYGLGTSDNPVFEGMHESSALIAGATVAAAEAVWRGDARRAVNVAGGLHHAMSARASGFCVYNDPAVAIARLLDLGAERVAYVDVDVHHGDGVQDIFWNDPRVLTVSVHETPLALFPGTGFPDETGGPGAQGTAVNMPLPPGVDDSGWQRAFHAIVPSVLRAFRPQVLVSQCGADGHRLDPLADLNLTVDGQRATYLAMRALADELCDGRWVATGGGGYALVEVVPRAWSHLLAVATGDPIDPATLTPPAWRDLVASRNLGREVPLRMTDDADPSYEPWQPTGEPNAVDRAIAATRKTVFPLLGLDPHDPRD